MSYTNIETVVAVLKGESARYKNEFDRLLKEKEQAIEKARNTFKQVAVENEIAKINKEFEESVMRLKVDASEIVKYVHDLRKYETERIGKSGTILLEKLSFLKDVPVSQVELQSVIDTHSVRGNYWCERMLCKIAETNNIDSSLLGLSASLDTKLSVLSQLERQYHSIITMYGDNGVDRDEQVHVKYTYLNDAICSHAVAFYNNTISLSSEVSRAQKVIANIVAQNSSFSRAFSISNAMKNAQTETNKNALMFALSVNKVITDDVLQMSGYYADICSFKANDLAAYERAYNAVETAKTVGTKAQLDSIRAEVGENRFIDNMLMEEAKRNDHVKRLLSEAETVTE